MNFLKKCTKNLPMCILFLLAVVVLIYFLYNLYNIDHIIESMTPSTFSVQSFPNPCRFERGLHGTSEDGLIKFLSKDENGDEKYLKYDEGNLVITDQEEEIDKFILGNTVVIDDYQGPAKEMGFDENKIYLCRYSDISDNLVVDTYLLEGSDVPSSENMDAAGFKNTIEFTIGNLNISKTFPSSE